MRTLDVIQGGSNRNQSLRLLLILIIVGTIPFYCFAIYLIGSAPAEGAAVTASDTPVPAASFTPLGGELFPSPRATSARPAFATMTPLSPPLATPVQYVPPTPIPALTLVSPTPTPTDTITPRPTATPGPADSDADGLTDDVDSCPTDFGFVDNNGCPWPDDPDRDGVRGEADRCPNEFAPDSARGCRDFDDDGLDTAADECPRQAGPAANRGCPLTGEVGG